MGNHEEKDIFKNPNNVYQGNDTYVALTWSSGGSERYGLWGVHTMEFYSAVKKKKILPFATAWMDLENIMLYKITQTKKRQILYDITHTWDLMNKLN